MSDEKELPYKNVEGIMELHREIAELKENQKELEETIVLNTCREIIKPYCPIRIADLTQIEENNKQIEKLKDKMKRSDLYCQGCGTFIENQKCWCYGCMESTKKLFKEAYDLEKLDSPKKTENINDYIERTMIDHSHDKEDKAYSEFIEELKEKDSGGEKDPKCSDCKEYPCTPGYCDDYEFFEPKEKLDSKDSGGEKEATISGLGGIENKGKSTMITHSKLPEVKEEIERLVGIGVDVIEALLPEAIKDEKPPEPIDGTTYAVDTTKEAEPEELPVLSSPEEIKDFLKGEKIREAEPEKSIGKSNSYYKGYEDCEKELTEKFVKKLGKLELDCVGHSGSHNQNRIIELKEEYQKNG